MGLLDKLWDDTLAGPPPDSGLSKLRKHSTFSFRLNKVDVEDDISPPPPKVTRSIMIKRPAGCPSPAHGTPPGSPAGSTPPVSPFAADLACISKRLLLELRVEERSGTDSGGDRCRRHTTRDLQEWWGWDPEVPLLLMRCEL